MQTFSHYGIGVKVHDIEKRPDGTVEFTLWFTFFWIPIIPLSSWSGEYTGEVALDALREDGHAFNNLKRIQRDSLCYLRTFSRSLLVLALAVAPSAYMIYRTTSRAATTLEMIFVFASALWPVILILLVEKHRRNLLKRPWT